MLSFRRFKQRPFLSLIILLAFLFLLENFGGNYFKTPIQTVLEPLQTALYKSKKDVTNFLATIKEIGSLRQREQALKQENALLTAENAWLKNLEEENRFLREQVGAKLPVKKQIAASVIGGDPLVNSSKLILDKGKADGVKEDALVVLKTILIGQISTVTDSTSTVRLLTDPETKIPAVTEAGAKGILEGEFGLKITLAKVLQDKELKEGQIVFTSGEAGFPKGLILGKIGKVKTDKAALFQKAAVEPLISFGSLETLFIIID